MQCEISKDGMKSMFIKTRDTAIIIVQYKLQIQQVKHTLVRCNSIGNYHFSCTVDDLAHGGTEYI